MGIRLKGPTGFGGDSSFDGLHPGPYLVTIGYQSMPKPEGVKESFWEGEAKTEPVAFEILDAANISKPVRVEGLEFTAQAPARVTAPRPAARPTWTSKCASSTSLKTG